MLRRKLDLECVIVIIKILQSNIIRVHPFNPFNPCSKKKEKNTDKIDLTDEHRFYFYFVEIMDCKITMAITKTLRSSIIRVYPFNPSNPCSKK